VPTEKSVKRIELYVQKYREKTGTFGHPDASIPGDVIQGLAQHLDDLGRPLCPCRFYPDKKKEVESSREWICACDEMKKYKFCHCHLFTTPEGQPITEYLPEDHDGRKMYGLVKDPTPGKGREGWKDEARG
jgi:ferredoxin-thioredoxin reductase catalytic chain